jgi:hypothetical protein
MAIDCGRGIIDDGLNIIGDNSFCSRENMLKCLVTVLTACVFSLPSLAQKGVAPNGYYPNSYFGATFTGVLQPETGELQEITLVYTKGNKSENFVGKLASPCSWKSKDGTVHRFRASEAPKGTVLTAFYQVTTNKSQGQKSQENVVVAISYAEVDGKRIPDEKRVTISCSAEPFVQFKAF